MKQDSKLPPENADTMTAREASTGPLAIAKACISIWSTVRQREAPSSVKTEHVRLITIVNSHFCEKVRWTLDMVEADTTNPYYYTEDAHPPGLHAYEPLKASNNKASITPMVVFHDKDSKEGFPPTVMWQSSEIMKKFMPSLYPAEISDKVGAMEVDLGKRLGSPLRCVAYYYFLEDLDKYHATAVSLSADPRKVAKIESTFFAAFLSRGLGEGIRKGMKMTDEAVEASIAELRVVFAELSERLENSGEYLMDQEGHKSYGFTAADLTLAALAYPFLRPPEMQHWLVDTTQLPVEMNSLSQELAATRAGKHVLKIYKDHRPVDEESGVVVMKYANRNRSFFGWLFGY